MMRNAKLWSVLLAAVLLCACIVGVLFTGASAADSRIPTATVTYTVGTDADTIRQCLQLAQTQEWEADDVLEIQFSGTQSAYVAVKADDGLSGWLLFGMPTIFRQDNTKLPIVIRGMDADCASKITTGQNGYGCANDYYFTNLTIGGGSSGKTVQIYAGSGEIVFENTKHGGLGYTFYYGDNNCMDSYYGWTQAHVDANKNKDGLMETGITFGNGSVLGSTNGKLIAAVGNNAANNSYIRGLKRAVADVTTALTDDQVAAALESAPEVTFYPSELMSEGCLVTPWMTKAYAVVDSGTKVPTAAEYGYVSARIGASPIREAEIHVMSGGLYAITADDHAKAYNETFVGDTKVIFSGGKLMKVSDQMYIRLSNVAQFIGDLTLEIHQGKADIPTYAELIQPSMTGATSTVHGNYKFLMTGGEIGVGGKANDGYWGAPVCTGQVVNEVTGGKLWAFYSFRYATTHANTDVTLNLPNGQTKTLKVGVHNKISGGTIGGLVNNAVSQYNGYFAGARAAALEVPILNDISGGDFYAYEIRNYDKSKNIGDVHNYVYDTATTTPNIINRYYGVCGTGEVGSVYNNIIGGKIGASYYAARYNVTKIVNNIYGGTFSDKIDFFGTAIAPAGSTFSIENNFYGGSLGGGWTLLGNYAGPCGTITNHFYSGADNPYRDAENPQATMLAAGTKLIDQVVAGGGYYAKTETDSLDNYLDNTCLGITNVMEGGAWLPADGAGASITYHGGMRFGDVNGDVTTTFVKGRYFRFYGGCDYGAVTGTVTNNYGKELKEGEEAPELVFTSYVVGGNLGDFDFPAKIAAALEAQSALGAGETLSAENSMYVELAAERGEKYNPAIGAVVNNHYYATYKGNVAGGSYGANPDAAGLSADQKCIIGTITNNVYGGVFDGADYYYCGGFYRNGGKCDSITNNVYGGTFNGEYYGGTTGKTPCQVPLIVNNFRGGEGCRATNRSIFMGNGGAPFGGVVESNFYDGWVSHKSYVFGGGGNKHTMPEGAEYAIVNTFYGGDFSGVWGQGGGYGSVLNGNIKNVIQGGIFRPYSDAPSMQNSFAAGPRNGTLNGNADTLIQGGTFLARVAGGVIPGNSQDAPKKLDGNLKITIQSGIFYQGVYAVSFYEAFYATGTATIDVDHAQGKPLALLGQLQADTYKTNGQTFLMGKDSNITVANLTGKLSAHQVEGWAAHDYLKLPAGSDYEITQEQGAYGTYTADDTILVKGVGFRAAGATIRLSDRLGVRVLLNKDDVDAYGDAFTYSVTFDGETLAEGTKADLVEYQGFYSFVFDGIGLSDFGEKMVISSPFFEEDVEKSIADLAVMAQTAWAENAKWKAYADAIIEFHNVYNLDAVNTMTPDAVAQIPSAARGAADGVTSASATLLMADAAGVRLSVTLNAAPVGAKILVNGNEVDAQMVSVSENTITADLYFAHEYLANEFIVSVQSDAGEHMTYRASIEGIANQLASNENNENKDNAQAFLVYIQKAVACK